MNVQTKMNIDTKNETNMIYRPHSPTSSIPCLSGRPRSHEDKGIVKDMQDKDTGTDEEPTQKKKIHVKINVLINTETVNKDKDRGEDNCLGKTT